jgi:hypothetical protein
MKSDARWLVAVAMAVVGLCGITRGSAATAQERAAAAARDKDPAWKPACDEVALIQVGDSSRPGALKNFCLNGDGNILACLAPHEGGDPSLRVYSPAGQMLKTLPLEIRPGAIAVAGDGSIFVAGEGRVLKLNPAGEVLASAASPVADAAVSLSKEVVEMLEQSGQSSKEQLDQMKASLLARRGEVTGLAVTDRDVFIAVPAPNDFTFRVYRFDLALNDPQLVVEKLRGCCGQMDIQAHRGSLWIPHNARHSVESRDRDGKELSKFGRAGKVKPADFGGCCEPKNMRVLANGEILVAESGPPTCIKRFTADGKFVEVVAMAKAKGDCVRVTVEASADGRRIYLLDTERDAIRVYGVKT